MRTFKTIITALLWSTICMLPVHSQLIPNRLIHTSIALVPTFFNYALSEYADAVGPTVRRASFDPGLSNLRSDYTYGNIKPEVENISQAEAQHITDNTKTFGAVPKSNEEAKPQVKPKSTSNLASRMDTTKEDIAALRQMLTDQYNANLQRLYDHELLLKPRLGIKSRDPYYSGVVVKSDSSDHHGPLEQATRYDYPSLVKTTPEINNGPINKNIYFKQTNPEVEQKPPSFVQQTQPPQWTNLPLSRNPTIDNKYSTPEASISTNKTDLYATALTNFGLGILLHTERSQTKNAVIAPVSIAILLAMLQQGSSGRAQVQISNALGLNPEESLRAFDTYANAFKKRRSYPNLLNVATKIYTSNTFHVEPSFKTIAIRNFNSDITPVAFSLPSNAAREINKWVSTTTHDKIKEIVTPDQLGASTQLVLANAIYFKGLWKSMFKKEATVNRQFHVSEGNLKLAPFMRARRQYKCDIDESASLKFIILPFEGDQYSLMVLMPQDGKDLNHILGQMSSNKLAGYHNAQDYEVDLQIPKFTARAELNLNSVFLDMEIRDIFSNRYSNLHGIGTYQGGVTPEVSSVLHTALLSIDEQGGTAAAATAVVAVALSYDAAEITFKVDRPFVAILWDHELKLPLFIARIEDPTL